MAFGEPKPASCVAVRTSPKMVDVEIECFAVLEKYCRNGIFGRRIICPVFGSTWPLYVLQYITSAMLIAT